MLKYYKYDYLAIVFIQKLHVKQIYIVCVVRSWPIRRIYGQYCENDSRGISLSWINNFQGSTLLFAILKMYYRLQRNETFMTP